MRSPFTISLFLALPFILTPSLAVPVNSNTTAITLPTHNVKLPPIYNLTGRDDGARSVEGVVRRDDPVNDAGDNMNTGPTGADQGAMSFDSGPYHLPPDLLSRSNLECKAAPEGPYHDSHKKMVKWSANYFCNLYTLKRTHIQGPVDTDSLRTNPSSFDSTITHWDYVKWGKGHHKRSLTANVTSSPGNLTKRWAEPGIHDDKYLISVKSRENAPGCGPLAVGPDDLTGKYNLWEPIEGWFCEDFLYAAWRECRENKGRGGSIDGGCLRYSIHTVD
ncbi:MAG: hypothetical protein HETSPECPRED_003300 [Heterodermia speciosa]|uniref:Uncharacterized protein n=1 Tax=Heterodermia speciosa TaxID=116794 RepID=A0A8H3EF08_9LECA|nr:MAG: hypothetical protein HETSPECPRED_003300 [Heterodermia speciosa]